MDTEKFNSVIGYFSDLSIELPTDVKNAIEDVFMENDNIDNVWCYHPEEKEDFEKDLTLTNEIKLSLEGLNVGSINNLFTYHGELDYSIKRSTKLFDSEGKEEEVIDAYFPEMGTTLLTPNEYAVVLVEKVEWDSGSKDEKLTRTETLYIYCPISDVKQPEPDRFDGVYNQLKSEGAI